MLGGWTDGYNTRHDFGLMRKVATRWISLESVLSHIRLSLFDLSFVDAVKGGW